MVRLEEVKQYAIEPLNSIFQRVDFGEIDRFISYDRIFFQEYVLQDSTCISVGITKRRGADEMHILLLRKKIKEIRENIDGYTNNGKKPFNPLVLVVDFKQKRWLKVKSELENYTNGEFFIGACGKVLTVIFEGVHKVYEKHKRVFVH